MCLCCRWPQYVTTARSNVSVERAVGGRPGDEGALRWRGSTLNRVPGAAVCIIHRVLQEGYCCAATSVLLRMLR